MDAFERLAAGKEEPLVSAALVLAQDEYPALDLELYHERMQLMEFGFKLLRTSDEPMQILTELNQYFFDELGFRGNTKHYRDPRNSYLSEVIDRKLGIPISLAALYQMLAKSAGITLQGINLPGHFVLGWYDHAKTRHYIDVFNGGKIVCEEELVPIVREASGQVLSLDVASLPAMSARQIILRMLYNLKGIYSQTDLSRCLRIQQRIVQLRPHEPSELRDLGIMYFHAGKPHRAADVFRGLMERDPQSAQSPELLEYFERASREAVLLN